MKRKSAFFRIKTESFKQTKKFAFLFAKEILKTRLKRKNALILALKGDLGSGKTTFVQGFLNGLGIRKKISSPTFVIIKNYKLRSEKFKNAYHVDCYRIKKVKELLDMGFEKILRNEQNIVLIEWPEKTGKILPKTAIRIEFKHGPQSNERIIVAI